MPQNVVAATSGLKTFNLIPAVGEQRALGQFISCIYNSITEWPWAVTAPLNPPSWPSPGRMMSFLNALRSHQSKLGFQCRGGVSVRAPWLLPPGFSLGHTGSELP